MTQVTVKKITTKADREKCFHIRAVVFVDEQKVPLQEEMDGLDDTAVQYLLTVDNHALATARVRYLDDIAKIERVAVLKGKRGLNMGKQLMEFIMNDIRQNPHIHLMKLGAQTQVIGFYEKLGFESYGDEFLDAGIPHKWMKCQL